MQCDDIQSFDNGFRGFPKANQSAFAKTIADLNHEFATLYSSTFALSENFSPTCARAQAARL